MNKTKPQKVEPITMNTAQLAAALGCGTPSAVKIGEAAQAKIKCGRRVLWSRLKIERYLERCSEGGGQL